MKVLVVGAGIGGLACAQGLTRRGHEVTIVERGRDISSSGGYKLHLGVPAVAALRDLLAPAVFDTLLGSAVGTRGFSIALRDHRGRRLLRVTEPSTELTLDVDRVTLRQILATGLDEHLLLGRTCLGWQIDRGTVTAQLDDASNVTAEVLVIADGAGSRLAEQLAGAPTSTPCGLAGVAGRSLWQDLPPAAQALLCTEPMLAIGPGGTGLFASAHDPVGQAAARLPLSRAATTRPVAIWGLIAVEAALPPRPSRMDPPDLLAASTALLRRHHWAEPMLDLLRLSEQASISAFRFNAADPGNLAPWPPGPVTAVGDAVHAMPPTGGQGAATAILDARALVERLPAVPRPGAAAVVAGIRSYETQLRVHAAPAVRESIQPLRWIRAAATPAGSAGLRLMTPVLAVGASLSEAVRRK